MDVDSGLEGVEETLKSLERLSRAQDDVLREALEYVLRAMCNYAKQHGPWTDRTGNLRNSISVNLNLMKLTPTGQDPGDSSAHERPVIEVQGDDYRGVLSAGMEYAIWVELTDGYWVLTGAIDRFEPMIDRIFGDKMSVEQLNLEEIAEVHYARFEERRGTE